MPSRSAIAKTANTGKSKKIAPKAAACLAGITRQAAGTVQTGKGGVKMIERGAPKFGIMTYHHTEGEWSVGFGITHDQEENYVWFNLVKWHVSIGFFARED